MKENIVDSIINKIDEEFEITKTSSTIKSLTLELNDKAVSQIINDISNNAEKDFKDSEYYTGYVKAISQTLLNSKIKTLNDIINKLDERTIDKLEKLLIKRRKAIILYSFIKIRNELIKRNKLKTKEFKLYNIENKLDDICNIYVSNYKYDISPVLWSEMNKITIEPIFIITKNTFGRTGKFKNVFDNIDEILKKIN